MRPLALALVAAGTLMACRGAQIHSMARTARIADLRFSDEYTDASKSCLAISDGWEEYDMCMMQWETAYDAMRIMFSATYVLDSTKSRDEFRKAGCNWYRSLQVVDATSPVELPSVKMGLESRWRKRCK